MQMFRKRTLSTNFDRTLNPYLHPSFAEAWMEKFRTGTPQLDDTVPYGTFQG